MLQAVIHLWQSAPASLPLVCPPPAAGQPPDPQGFYDYSTVAAAFSTTAWASAIIVIGTVTWCYALARGSLGRSFVGRWWLLLVLTGVMCFGAAWLILARAPTTALAGSCTTDPDAFPVALPGALILGRSLVALVWGPLAYIVLSLIATATVGRFAHPGNGFFHNRGCPAPRFLP